LFLKEKKTENQATVLRGQEISEDFFSRLQFLQKTQQRNDHLTPERKK
jgi:hypothetical protein